MKNLQFIKQTFVLFIFILSAHFIYSQNEAVKINENNIIISGKVIDVETAKPIAFVSVSVKGTNIGTVTNTEGEFTVRFEKELNANTLTFKYIGYQNLEVPINSFKEKKFKVKMKPAAISIQEVIIRPNHPEDIIREALKKIPDNYSIIPNKEMAFYREYVKKRRKYVSVSEAVVEIYKAPYNNKFAADLVKLYKGHKSADVKAQDTIIMKLRGGPKTALLMDIAKNPDILFSENKIKQYNFTLTEITNIDNQQNYIINFQQKPNQQFPLFNGKVYVNIKTLAITAVEFSLNLENKDEASRVFVRKKPLFMTIMPTSTKYMVSYKQQNGKYYFSHARGEVNFSVKWKRRLFKSHYSVMTEIAITDRTDKNVQKIPKKEQLKGGIIFGEKVYPLSDQDFWGKYNTIKPEEAIEKAIKKYGVKLKIQNN